MQFQLIEQAAQLYLLGMSIQRQQQKLNNLYLGTDLSEEFKEEYAKLSEMTVRFMSMETEYREALERTVPDKKLHNAEFSFISTAVF